MPHFSSRNFLAEEVGGEGSEEAVQGFPVVGMAVAEEDGSAVVRINAELLGGTVRVQALEPHGTRFLVEVPEMLNGKETGHG